MTADQAPPSSVNLRWLLAGVGLVAIVLAAGVALLMHGPAEGGISMAEKLAALRAERASLLARADGEARLRLLDAFRTAGLLSDALAARHESDTERPFEALPAVRQRAFAELDTLNATLREAQARQGEGARLAARAAAGRAAQALERMAESGDDLPMVLSVSPRFVAPRRATGELTLGPRAAAALPRAPPLDTSFRLEAPRAAAGEQASPTVPRYAPDFAASADDDPPVRVEIVGLHLATAGGPRPVLALGGWRGEAEMAPARLFFSVPRSAFVTEAARTTLANATLAVRRGARTLSFQLTFVVLPDRPGSFALDQKVRETAQESNTLVSPEVLARAGVGESRSTRRCFDPPAGWRFDKAMRRVVIVERLGWIDDIGDPTLNGGSVEFAADEGPDQICFVATAKAATKAARTATIGRFEATLVRDRPVERALRSGVRALDWREPARVAIAAGTIEQKLYVKLFDEIDLEFDGTAAGRVPFLRITYDRERSVLVLQADPAAEP